MVEFSRSVGAPLFPVGYETYDAATFLIDPDERCFLLHHSGPHFLGKGTWPALDMIRRGGAEEAWEDFV
uniref:SUKH-3 domain-containing protein n=1 Tax=Streptomyces solicavernae TaxID=3043614 RepID=UPI0038D1ABE2